MFYSVSVSIPLSFKLGCNDGMMVDGCKIDGGFMLHHFLDSCPHLRRMGVSLIMATINADNG